MKNVCSDEEIVKLNLRDEKIKEEVDSDDERDSEVLSDNKRIMNEKPRMYECSLCGKSLRNLRLLSTHMNDQHLKQKRETQTKSTNCEECEKYSTV